MRQINFNIQGSPGPVQAFWVADTGQRFPLQADLPGRMIVQAVNPAPPLRTGEGSSVDWNGQRLARLLIPPEGFVGEATDPICDMQPQAIVFPPLPIALPQIVGDHFELGGNRWVWRMIDGFCDHAQLFTGNLQQVRNTYTQAQDLDSRGKRIFGMMQNITHFDPRENYPKYWDTLDQLVAISAEFEQPLQYVVFADAQLLGMDLGWCQAHWAQVCARLQGKAFISLVNQWNHAGNLVGQPNDYTNPGGLASQGSANEDTNPPNPTDNTGAGYQYWEWCSSVNPTHWSHEYFIWKGLSTGRAMPCVISEPGQRLEESAVDLDYVRSETHASMANGVGLTIHSTPGKFSQLLGPNISAAVRLSMSLLAAGQA